MLVLLAQMVPICRYALCNDTAKFYNFQLIISWTPWQSATDPCGSPDPILRIPALAKYWWLLSNCCSQPLAGSTTGKISIIFLNNSLILHDIFIMLLESFEVFILVSFCSSLALVLWLFCSICVCPMTFPVCWTMLGLHLIKSLYNLFGKQQKSWSLLCFLDKLFQTHFKWWWLLLFVTLGTRWRQRLGVFLHILADTCRK